MNRTSGRVLLIATLCFISGCGKPTAQREAQSLTHSQNEAGNTAALPPRKHVRNCDFSEYHPLRMSSDWLWRGAVVKGVPPIYPAEAKQKGLQGAITLRLLINSDGSVEQACADNGDPLLRDAAERAALQWLFRAPRVNGKSIPYVQDRITFNFVLDGNPRPPAPE